MARTRRIPEATVSRLPLYLRVLGEVSAQQTLTISSDALAARAGVNAAQVRKDLSYLGSYGTRGVGYDVTYLVRQINRRLGLDADRRVAIVGAGNLGHALATYGGFPARGFEVVAVFDSDPSKVGSQLGRVSVSDVASMRHELKERSVEIAIITTPASVAQNVVDEVIAGGVGSILNFAPARVLVPPQVTLRQVDLGVELQILSFYQQSLEASSA